MQNTVLDEMFIIPLFEKLYDSQMRVIREWLDERKDKPLNHYQVHCLSLITKARIIT